jgi:hypothetical protein
MVYKGKVLDISENGVATVKIAIDLNEVIRHAPQEAYVELVDSRPLSDEQRRTAYMFIKAISDWTGESLSSTKKHLKLDFIANNLESLADRMFSLANAPMSVVAEFQRYLVNFIVENDIPVNFRLYEFIDDSTHYIFCCLVNKKCAVCGKLAELHHVDAVGMGRDREEIVHEGMECISLCREHHTEAHTLGNMEFMKKYHFEGGIALDRTLCKIYKLKEKK